MKTVEVLVKPDGSVKVTYNGFVGEACFEEAKKVYERLKSYGVDVKIESVERTAEAYVTQKQKVVNRV